MFGSPKTRLYQVEMEQYWCVILRQSAQYLVLHELSVVAIDFHLLGFLLPLFTAQHATGAKHHHLVLQLSEAPLQRTDLRILRDTSKWVTPALMSMMNNNSVSIWLHNVPHLICLLDRNLNFLANYSTSGKPRSIRDLIRLYNVYNMWNEVLWYFTKSS